MLLRVLGTKDETVDSGNLDTVGIRYTDNGCEVIGVGKKTYTLLKTKDESIARKLVSEIYA